jgi:CheY-like chemotaxis protein
VPSRKLKENDHMTGRIMVVDDDSALRMTLQEILMDEGRDVITAEDGFQAIQLASEGPIDLIFMDIRMPGMDGVETFLKIKEILPDCIVVMMTGYAVESLIEKALSQGAKTCLSKPVSIEQLLEIADEVVPESFTS